MLRSAERYKSPDGHDPASGTQKYARAHPLTRPDFRGSYLPAEATYRSRSGSKLPSAPKPVGTQLTGAQSGEHVRFAQRTPNDTFALAIVLVRSIAFHMHGYIAAIEYYLPDNVITTEDLATAFPGWPAHSIATKTGIQARRIAAEDECASDLAVMAAQQLFTRNQEIREQIDFILLCTQSPDFMLPTTACLLQDRLGISTTAGALDINLGCSGFVYGLGMAEGLIASHQARSVLLITADTYSKYLDKTDKAARAIFGDGAAATLILAREGDLAHIGPFLYGTDGSGGRNLILPDSGTRRLVFSTEQREPAAFSVLGRPSVCMNGTKIFEFAINTVPLAINGLLTKCQLTLEDIDLFVMHQANAYLLEEIRRVVGIPTVKLQLTISHCANTISSTIPIALKHAAAEGRLRPGDLVMLIGFGVGYSWGATLIRWLETDINPAIGAPCARTI